MHNRFIYYVSLLLSVFLLTSLGQAEPLVWFNSLDTARASAVEQGKLILLLAGRPTCGNCTYMKNEVCEAPNVRPVIDEACVPWFSDIDLSTDWQPYRAGLASFYLPLACVIDPKTTNAWLARRTGLCTATTFEDFLRGALRSYPPQPNHLISQQVIHDDHYQVTGHIWTNAQPTAVFYRVTPGTNAANPFVSATGSIDWTAALAPYLVAGVSNQYAFDVYAEFANGSQSPTNRLVFNYDPTGTPSLAPQITFIGVTNRIVNMTLTNLAIGVAIQVERSLQLGVTNRWLRVTNFISSACASEVVEEADPAWARAFYRVSSMP